MNTPLPGRIVVKGRQAGENLPALLHQVLTHHAGTTVYPLFSSVSAGTIAGWVDRAKEREPGYQAPDFSSYYAVSCADGVNIEQLVHQFSLHKEVELAYAEHGFIYPPYTAAPLRRGSGQGYLNPAPEGINARYAWQLAGGQGEGAVRFIDIEQGWLPCHEAVALHLLPDTGINCSNMADHGTAVLGILTLQENETGATGIIPGATGHVISQWRPDGFFNTADAIMTAIGHLEPGDVLLLQAQAYHNTSATTTWPVEIHDACFQAIRLAVTLGIIVIEPAGNGSTAMPAGNDLDTFMINEHPVFNPLSNHYLDSGAIMVAAASATAPHTRMDYSNYGRRVNCYAWGESVHTAGNHPRTSGIAINTYTGAFGGTSAAAAIIAGAAIALQSITEANHHFRLNPSQMRTLLGSDEFGTPSAAGRFADKIGVMPNLLQIISEGLLITPSIPPRFMS